MRCTAASSRIRRESVRAGAFSGCGRVIGSRTRRGLPHGQLWSLIKLTGRGFQRLEPHHGVSRVLEQYDN